MLCSAGVAQPNHVSYFAWRSRRVLLLPLFCPQGRDLDQVLIQTLPLRHMMLSTRHMEFLEDLWRSIGLEVVIFVVTLCCAFLVRGFSPKAGPGRKVISPQNKAVDLPRAPVSRRRDEKNSPPGAGLQPADVLREVMQCLQEHGGPARPARILGLYAELRHLLQKSGKTLQEVARGHTAIELYTGLAQLVIRTGKHQSLDSIIDDMVENQVPRSLAFYESVMKQLAVQKQFRLALRVYDRLVEDGLETTAITYSCLIRFAAEVGDFTRAKDFFEKLSSLATPSIRAYMTILGVHNKRQDWPSALAVIQDIKVRGVAMDSLALNVALSTGVAADKVEEVLALLAEAEQTEHCMPDVVSYNTIIKAFAQRANYSGACEVLERMHAKKRRPNAITFNTVMDAAVRAGKPEEAWTRLQEMRKRGFKPDKFTCSILVKAFCKASSSVTEASVDRALCLLDEANECLDPTLKATLYNNVLEVTRKATEGSDLMML
ncbi:unnamed protein product [Durusdinium trenchii]|uniref:PROP1-like PPR domain-containing protein n=1 Tax=Durusdinium trenchii TaxID=1381693 RepID=A0ABP0K4P1_9DINO